MTIRVPPRRYNARPYLTSQNLSLLWARAKLRRSFKGFGVITMANLIGPSGVKARLDDKTRARMNAYMAETGMNQSAVTRLALAMLFDHKDRNPDAIFHEIAFREGVLKGVSAFHRAIKTSVEEALKEYE